MTGWIFPLPALAIVLTSRRWIAFGQQHDFRRAIIIGLVGAGIGTFALSMVLNKWVFALVYFATGLFLAAVSPSVGAITCTKVDPGFRGRAYGIQQAAGIMGQLVMCSLAGLVGSLMGNRAIFATIGAALLMGAVIFRILGLK